MDTKTMLVWVMFFAIVVVTGGLIAYAAVANVKAKSDVAIFKAQEMTKRAHERHELLDILGKLKHEPLP